MLEQLEKLQQKGRASVEPTQPIYIQSSGTVVGKMEGEGPLASYFDMICDTDKFGEETWEAAESRMQKEAVTLALGKASLQASDIRYIFAGDLLGQNIATCFGLMDYEIPLFGLYGACSTFAESLMLSALMVNAGYFNVCAAVTSSHFCTAERQFRFPLEYGGQRTPTAQRTATASGAAVISSTSALNIKISEVLPGRIIDKGVTDINNMGAAMAPAAIDTLARY